MSATIMRAMNRSQLWFLPILVLFLYLLSRASGGTGDVQDWAKQSVVSPDDKWVAVLRADTRERQSAHPTPIDSLYIENHLSRKTIVRPVFVAKWQPGLNFQLKWLAPDQLQVVFPAQTEFLSKEVSSGEVSVTYTAMQAPRD